VIAGFVSSYWHYSDRISVKPKITINQVAITKAQEIQKLKDAGYFAPKLKVGATRYYTLEEKGFLPGVPMPEAPVEKPDEKQDGKKNEK
jgi:hypothetical protein